MLNRRHTAIARLLKLHGKLPQEVQELGFIPEVMNHPCKDTASIIDMYEKSMGELLLPTLNILVKNQPVDQSIVCIAGTIDMLVDLDNSIVTDFMVFDRTKNCTRTDYKIIVYNVLMSFIEFGTRNDMGHGTALVANSTNKTIEFFDPTGTEGPWHNTVLNRLQIEFAKVLPGYRFIISGFCPDIGDYEGEGICGAYTLLFLILKMYNYQLGPEQLEARLGRLSRYQLTDLMRQFLCYIDDLYITHNLYEMLVFSKSLTNYVRATNPTILGALKEVIDNGSLQELIDFANRNGVPLIY